MTVSSLKDLKALIKACRQLGVNSIEVDGVKLVLGSLPIKERNSAIDETAFPEASIQVPKFNGPVADPETPETEGLTEDQLMFYSAQGHNELEQ